MTLKVLPMEAEDCVDWARLYYPAFSPAPIGILWRQPPSEDEITSFAKVLQGGLDKPEARTFKCIDTDLDNKIIAVAKWSIFEEPRSMEDVEATFVLRPTFDSENREARRAFMEGIWKSRREVMGGKPHVMLDSLICHPDHHRRGAGRMLVQWGIDEADRLGIQAYLEGSAAGVRLYRSVGYEDVRQFTFDTTQYGGIEPDVHIAMIRPARKIAVEA